MISRRLHSLRPRHSRKMSLALSHVEHAQRLKRIVKRMSRKKPGKQTLMWDGVNQMREAINEVVECGCPRDMWPKKVQESLVETDIPKSDSR